MKQQKDYNNKVIKYESLARKALANELINKKEQNKIT